MMKAIKRLHAYLFCAAMLAAGLAMASCSDASSSDGSASQPRAGYLTIDLNINGEALSRATTEHDPEHDLSELNTHEDDIREVDLFIYPNDADDLTPAIYHYHNDVDEGDEIAISTGELPTSLQEGDEFKIVVVANCQDKLEARFTDNLPTIEELKSFETQVEVSGEEGTNHRSFRGEDAPQAFVMTNLEQSDSGKNKDLKLDLENGTVATISLKRVAAKIRVALAVDKVVKDEDGEWEADVNNMRLYFSNGVRTARLDGDVSKLTLVDDPEDLEHSDYFNITTTGNKVDENSNYNYARAINPHTSNMLTGTEDKIYIYYNDLPHYTYPTSWTGSFTDAHQPMLTIVIPWKRKDDSGTTTFQPTYYSVPVNKGEEIVSNTYYYIRTHIGMKGSTTPEVPMPVDIESEILDWGKAEPSEIELKPIRYLILNQTQFEIPNRVAYTFPFNSTHPCSVVDCKLFVVGVNGDYGDEYTIVIDDNTTYGPGGERSITPTYKAKGKLYDYSIDNNDNTVTFTHHMFEGLFNLKVSRTTGDRRPNLFYTDIADRGNDKTYDELYNEKRTDETHGTYTYKKHVVQSTKKLYSRFYAEITLRHTDKVGDASTPYEEVVRLYFYPNIYLSSNAIDASGGLSNHDGWILVNGYGTSDTNTGDLKNVSGADGDAQDSRALLTFTVTTLNEDDKANRGWVLDDPRTLYINNLLSDASMNTDAADNLTRWTTSSHGGPYDGTQRSGGSSGDRHDKGSGLSTMWEYFEGPVDWTIPWSYDTAADQWKIWNAKDDIFSEDPSSPQYHRSLSYYYPAHEAQEKGNIIAPKFTIVSYHAYAASGSLSKQTARRRCAAYQQWGYPAGRWRLPTFAEIQFIKELQKTDVILDVFGGSDNWSAQGRVNSNGVLSTTDNTAYTRCVYDDWYWEQVDANGTSYNRIPDPDGSHANWKKFHWGDRPKENPLNSKSPSAPTVKNFLKKMNEIR